MSSHARPDLETAPAPAPWTLTGDGYLLLWRLPGRVIREQAGASPELALRHRGLSAVVLANYSGSNVGPYSEILFIPGRHRVFEKQYYWSISRIYVSSEASARAGRANWGLPKQVAEFATRHESHKVRRHVVFAAGTRFADLRLGVYPPSFPFNTRMLPPGLCRFAQIADTSVKGFQFEGRGTAQPARFLDGWFDSRFFPDLNAGWFLFGLRLSGFAMRISAAVPLPVSKLP
jgi:hypothetical protein